MSDDQGTSNSERTKRLSNEWVIPINSPSGPMETATSNQSIEPPPIRLPVRSSTDRLSRQMLEEAVPKIRELQKLSTAGGPDATYYAPSESSVLFYNSKNFLNNNQTTYLADEMPTLSEWSEFSAKLLKLHEHACEETARPSSFTDACTSPRLDDQIRGIIERQS